jgi:hypothetical protein
MRESFGLQNPMARKAAVNVARRLAAGEELTGQELQFAQSQPILQGMLRKYGARQAGPEFEEILKITGEGTRLRESEASRVEINNRVTAEINLNAEALADQMLKKENAAAPGGAGAD